MTLFIASLVFLPGVIICVIVAVSYLDRRRTRREIEQAYLEVLRRVERRQQLRDAISSGVVLTTKDEDETQ